MLVGLDLSTSCTGIAILEDDSNKVYTFEITGNPLQQLEQIKAILYPFSEVVYEQHVHFRNAKVTNKLIELNGYIKLSLEALGYNVNGLFPRKNRKTLLAQYEGYKLSKDKLDSVVLLHYYLQPIKPFEVVSTTYEKYMEGYFKNEL